MTTAIDTPVTTPAAAPEKVSAANWSAWTRKVAVVTDFLDASQLHSAEPGQPVTPIESTDVAAAIPAPGTPCTPAHMRMALVRMNTSVASAPIAKGKSVDQPSLFIGADEEMQFLPTNKAAPADGTLLVVKIRESRRRQVMELVDPSWFRSRLAEFVPSMGLALALTIISNVLALSAPLFAMAVYDRVIASGSIDTLISLSIGAAAALVLEVLMRRLRASIMADQGAHLGYSIGNTVFGRLLALPMSVTEGATTATQLARVRDLERIRDLLTGPIAQSCLDLPFVAIFLGAIAMIGGWLVLSPVVALFTFAFGAMVMMSRMRSRITSAAETAGQRQLILLDMIEKMRAIRASGATEAWRERAARANARAVQAGERHTVASALVGQLSQALVLLGGLTTLVVGVHMVIKGEMGSGALIAVMIMTWRLLQPLQTMFVAATRLGQISASVRQIDAFMQLQAERGSGGPAGAPPVLQGQVQCNRVIFRYGPQSEPVLSGLSFEAKAGEVIAIVGRNGSGKSTLLKLIAGLYTPQVGSIRIDGRDVGQFDPAALRRAIAFVPQVPQMLPGTIADNLRLGEPLATDTELWKALEAVGARELVEALPNGLATEIGTHSAAIPVGLVTSLSLARAWVRKASLILIDEPVGGMDPEAEFAFTSAVARQRGKATVFFVTHRRSHIGIADRVLILENGGVRHFGPAMQAREHIIRGMI